MCAGDCVHGCTVPESVRYLPTYRTVWVPNLCLYLYPLYLPVHTCISALTASICPVPVPVLMITIYVCRWLCAWLCCTCNWTCTYPPTSTYLPTYLSICTGICFFRLGDCAPDCPDPGKLVRIIQAFPVFHLLKTRKIFLFFKLRVSGLQTLSNLRSIVFKATGDKKELKLVDPQRAHLWVLKQKPLKKFYILFIFFSFKNNRRTNVVLVNIFENAQESE